ncbi:hypothetical protein Sgou_01000 [Streptomyces gougerotii]|uniref:Uncharacterized protein n=1 Tax=Streptomyces gougerotii TaxID=53448 RepID=A0ABQ1CYN8_9ACTN|nr:hypothetical protein Sgou_01000 [Streptomyces gougerotii]
MAADAVLDHGRSDVLAARGDDDLLLAAGDREVAVLVEGADVPGVEPAVGQRLTGRRLVVPVPVEEVLAVEQDLAVVGDADHRTGQRLTDRADLLAVPRVEGGGRAGLGQAVPLQHREADAAVEVAEPLAERGAAGDRVLAAAAEDRVELAVDQLGEDLVLQLQAEGGTLRGVQRPAVGDRGLRGLVEDLALAVGLRLGARRVVNLLEDARDAQDHGRAERGQLVGEVLDVRHQAQTDGRHQRGDLHQPAEDVRHREEEQHRALAGAEEGFEPRHHVAALGEEAAVGQHAALGTARGTRGVDDRRRVVGAGQRAALVDRLVTQPGPGPLQLRHAAGVQLPDVLQRRQPAAHRLHRGGVPRGLHDAGDGARVAEYPLDLLRRTRLVHRYGDRAGAPDREVHQRPLVPRTGEQPHPVAGLDAGGHQALGGCADLGEEGRGGQVLPRTVHLPGDHGHIRVPLRVAPDDVGEISVRWYLVQGRKAELAQDCCSS